MVATPPPPVALIFLINSQSSYKGSRIVRPTYILIRPVQVSPSEEKPKFLCEGLFGAGQGVAIQCNTAIGLDPNSITLTSIEVAPCNCVFARSSE